MSRAAVVLDPIFKKVGLSGKSVIPFVITVGCAVPGIMASRTIRNERERRATAMLAPFMPCGAKIPVIALFAGAFFDNAGWVSALMYFSGIALIFLSALLINLITGYNARKSFFIIELPEYKVPSVWGAFKSMCSRGWAYIVAYLVYTIGTLIVGGTLNIAAAIGGAAAIAVMIGFIISLIINTDRKMKAEYALKSA